MRKKLWALLLISAMTAASLAGCGRNSSKEGESDSGNKDSQTENDGEKEDRGTDEVVTLSMYVDSTNTLPDTYPWFVKYLEENLGIRFDVSQSTTNDGKAELLVGGGELPDITIMYQDTVYDAVDAGLFLDLSEYADQLPNVFEDDYFKPGIDYNRDIYGNGTAVYALPLNVSSGEGVYADMQPYIRWDVYKKIGYPEMKTAEEFLDVLKQMVEACPETEDGVKTYAFSTWVAGTAYDSICYQFARMMEGGTTDGLGYLGMVKLGDENEFVFNLREDSGFYRALELMFEANQLGLVDPDGTTMTGEEYKTNVANGKYMYTVFKWMEASDYNTKEHTEAEDWSGYKTVWPEFMTIEKAADTPVGNQMKLGISSECENVDAALKFVNWFYSEEACSLMINGPEGVLYEIQDGKRVPTDIWFEEGYSHEMEDGGDLSSLASIFGAIPRNGSSYLDDKEERLGIGQLQAFKSDDNISNLDKDWQEYNDGYETLYERAEETGYKAEQYKSEPLCISFFDIGDSYGDVETADGQAFTLIDTAALKMIYASDRAEFDAVWEQLLKDLDTLGWAEVEDWYLNDYYLSAIERSSKYMWE